MFLETVGMYTSKHVKLQTKCSFISTVDNDRSRRAPNELGSDRESFTIKHILQHSLLLWKNDDSER